MFNKEKLDEIVNVEQSKLFQKYRDGYDKGYENAMKQYLLKKKFKFNMFDKICVFIYIFVIGSIYTAVALAFYTYNLHIIIVLNAVLSIIITLLILYFNVIK